MRVPFPSLSGYASGTTNTQSYTVPGAASLTVTFGQVWLGIGTGDKLYVYDGTGKLIQTLSGLYNAGWSAVVPGETVTFRLVAATGGGWDRSQLGYAVTDISASSTMLVFQTASPLPAATLGWVYRQPLTVSGGIGPYSFTLTVGSLPAGLRIDGNMLGGTPEQAGTFSFTIQATDQTTGVGIAKNFELLVTAPDALTITTEALPNAQINRPYQAQVWLNASGGVMPYKWATVSGALPPGLSLRIDGLVSGTPVQSGAFTFTAQCADARGAVATKYLTISVLTGAEVLVTTPYLPSGYVGVQYSQAVSATGGTKPYSWTAVSGSLPPGLALSSGGAVAGTPSLKGTFSFTVRATDSLGASGDRALSIEILDAGDPGVGPNGLRISTESLPGAQLGKLYSTAIVASGGTKPYTFSLSSGSLPAGLALSAQGTLSGTPLGAAGAFTFTVQVADSATPSGTATRTYALVVSQTEALGGATQWFTLALYGGEQSAGGAAPRFYDETPQGVIDGANRTFTIRYTPNPQTWCQLSLNGSKQHPGEQIDIVGNAITYAVAPRPGDRHYCWYVVAQGESSASGNARRFAGGTDILNWGHHDALNIQGDLSIGIGFMIAPDADTSKVMPLIMYGYDGSLNNGNKGASYQLLLRHRAGSWRLVYCNHYVKSGIQTAFVYEFASPSFPSGVWRYAGISRDMVAKTVVACIGDYSGIAATETVDDATVTNVTDMPGENNWADYENPTPLIATDPACALFVGNAPSVPEYTGGKITIEEQYIWNRAVTQGEHTEAMRGNPSRANLVLACAPGSSPEQDTASGYTGTVTGTALVEGHI